MTIDCASLNRTIIDAYTCGACLGNYVGHSTKTKSSCVSKKYASVASKTCSKGCSSHGRCVFIDIYSQSSISSCNMESSMCIAKCDCDSNSHGDDCSMSLESLHQLQDAQQYVLTQLEMVSKDVDSQSRELVEATMNSTAALFVASNTAVMTDNSLIMSSNIVASTMRNAIKVDIPIKAILVYNDMIDNCIDLLSASRALTRK